MIHVIYYAHSMAMYGTEREREELKLIQKAFPDWCVYNPNRPYIQNHKDPMKACIDVVEECQAVAFSKHKRKISHGVLFELRVAQKKDIPLYIITGNVEKFQGTLKRKKR